MKVYHQFQDVYGHQYAFPSFIEFAKFWFSLPYQAGKQLFEPRLWNKLQYAAASSKEAKSR
jgi:hypothetical protein